MGNYLVSTPRRFAVVAATSLVPCLMIANAAHGQAAPSAIRSQSVDIFAGASAVQTDYNSKDKGFVVGGDFSYHLRHFDASLDLRYNAATGSRVGEKFFAGGGKIAKPLGRYHPYADLLIGYGVITFDTPTYYPDGSVYSRDNSTIYDFGGGVDIDLTRRFALKVDAQYQYWNLGTRGNVNSVSFNPYIGSIGVVYHLPYRFLRPRRY